MLLATAVAWAVSSRFSASAPPITNTAASPVVAIGEPSASPDGTATDTGTASVPDSTTSSNVTSSPAVTGSADGLVTVSPANVAAVPTDTTNAVVAVLDRYFARVNSKDLSGAYAAYSPQEQAKNSYSDWSRAVAGSSIEGVSIVDISGATSTVGSGRVRVLIDFTSHQPGDLGPVPGETCSRWSLAYSLVPDDTGSGYLIDDARPASGKGNRGC